MILIPIGHEESSSKNVPLVAITLAAACVIVHALAWTGESSFHRREFFAAETALKYWVEHNYLQLDEALQQRTGLDTQESLDAFVSNVVVRPPEAAQVRREQRHLDELTETWQLVRRDRPVYRWGLVPAEPHTLNYLTAIFLHGGIMHLLGNLLFLAVAGPPLEELWGRWFFAAFYLGVGILANVYWVARYPDSAVPLIGASGAISGLMGAFFVRFFQRKIKMFYLVGFWWYGTFLAPAWLMIGLWLVREVVFGQQMDALGLADKGGTANWVHVGGFVFGAGIAALVKWFSFEAKYLRSPEPDPVEELGGLEAAWTYFHQGQREKAWNTVVGVLRERPHDREAIHVLWQIAVSVNRTNQAVKPMVGLMVRDLRRGSQREALESWDEIREHAPETPLPPDLQLQIVQALIADHRPSDAALLVTRLLERIPENANGEFLGQVAVAALRMRAPGSLNLARQALRHPDLPAQQREEIGYWGEEVQRHGERPRVLSPAEVQQAEQAEPAEALTAPPTPPRTPPPAAPPGAPVSLLEPLPGTSGSLLPPVPPSAKKR